MRAYKICISDPFPHCESVFPVQQKKVREIIDRYSKVPQVKRIILFGSSVTTHCNVWSDVDLYVDLSEDVMLSKRGLDFDCDLWTTYTVDENLKEEIMRTGVAVYEKERE